MNKKEDARDYQLTAIVLTFNEEKHIARCINSIRQVSSRICVIDSHSTDGTVDVARSLGAEVYVNPWKNYSTQFQWALDNCKIHSDWTMRIDADEYLEPDLVASINHFLRNDNGCNAAYLRRKMVFLGSPILHGFFYPSMMLRIWRSGQGVIESRWMDEHIVVSDPNVTQLRGDLVDENLNDLAWWASKHISYAQREVYDLVEMEHLKGGGSDALSGQARLKRFLKYNAYARLPIGLRGTFYFCYRYFLGLGFLDGRSGFFFHFLQAFWYRVLVDAKLYELKREAAKARTTPYQLLCSKGIFTKK